MFACKAGADPHGCSNKILPYPISSLPGKLGSVKRTSLLRVNKAKKLLFERTNQIVLLMIGEPWKKKKLRRDQKFEQFNKSFSSIIYSKCNKLARFYSSRHFRPSLTFASMARTLPV